MEEQVPEPRYMKTPNGRIAWWMFEGDSDKVPAVFVHGGPGDGCDPLKGPKMDMGRRVYLYDQLGCGQSDPIPHLETWTADDYTEELKLFLDNIGEEKVILIGASWGAGLIMSYVAKYGLSKVACMVLPSPFFSSRIWYEDQITNMKSVSETMYLRMMDFVNGRAPPETYTEIMTEYYARFLFAREENRPIAKAVAEEGPNPVFRAMWGPNDMVCTGTLMDFDVTDALPTVDVPVLYMCGDSDEVTIPTMLEYRECTPGSRFAVVSCAGHAVGFEQFDCYRRNIISFLKEYGF